MDLEEQIRKTDFAWYDNTIHLFIGGSGLHSAKGDKPTDLDIMGVYIQPVEHVLGIPQYFIEADGRKKWFNPDVQVWSTAEDSRKNTADDVDINLYSLRKWAGMAATGNTTALEFLFAENQAQKNWQFWNNYIVLDRKHFISRRAGFHFMEFSKEMLRRLQGKGTGKHGQRDNLIEEFGYDPKAALHLLRVLSEGIELMNTGTITLPRPDAEFLKLVRRGKFTFPEIEVFAANGFNELQAAQEKSTLPPDVDREKISKIITVAQMDFWGHEVKYGKNM
jgi:predicted nucleotidyltransferase